MRLDAELAEFLTGGVAAIVATRDDGLRPQIARAWGIRPSPDGARVTLCVEAAAGSRTGANLEANGAVAATFSLPTTYRTVQIKGEAVGIGEPTADQLAAVEEHVAAFSRESEQVGIAPGGGRRLLDLRLAAVTVAVREVYDQTPGPKAGTPL
ncbi:MAG TPA: pyridoxamine 5'-phosphate oxidase family protein [Gaiellaceae bacterium]